MGAVGTLTSVRLTGSDGFVAHVTLGIRTGVSLILRLGPHNVESNVTHRSATWTGSFFTVGQPAQVSGVRTYLSSGFSPQAVSGIIGLTIELISGTLTLIEIDKT